MIKYYKMSIKFVQITRILKLQLHHSVYIIYASFLKRSYKLGQNVARLIRTIPAGVPNDRHTYSLT